MVGALAAAEGQCKGADAAEKRHAGDRRRDQQAAPRRTRLCRLVLIAGDADLILVVGLVAHGSGSHTGGHRGIAVVDRRMRAVGVRIIGFRAEMFVKRLGGRQCAVVDAEIEFRDRVGGVRFMRGHGGRWLLGARRRQFLERLGELAVEIVERNGRSARLVGDVGKVEIVGDGNGRFGNVHGVDVGNLDRVIAGRDGRGWRGSGRLLTRRGICRRRRGHSGAKRGKLGEGIERPVLGDAEIGIGARCGRGFGAFRRFGLCHLDRLGRRHPIVVGEGSDVMFGNRFGRCRRHVEPGRGRRPGCIIGRHEERVQFVFDGAGCEIVRRFLRLFRENARAGHGFGVRLLLYRRVEIHVDEGEIVGGDRLVRRSSRVGFGLRVRVDRSQEGLGIGLRLTIVGIGLPVIRIVGGRLEPVCRRRIGLQSRLHLAIERLVVETVVLGGWCCVGEHGVERARRRVVVVSERRRLVMGERRGIVLDIEVAEQFLFEIDLERRSIVRIVGRLRLVLARIMTHDPRQFGERIGVVELRTHVRSERVAVCHTHFSQSPPPRCLRHRGRIGPTSALWAKGDEAAWVYLAHLGRSFRSDQRQAGRQDIRNGLHQTQPGMSQFWVVNLNKA